jgi:hypothetical protein
VYLQQLTADQVASGNASLNETQLKAMNCLRDATEKTGAINLHIAKDSFTYWMSEKEELDASDKRLKDRARMAWKRALNALVDANIVVFAEGGKRCAWVQETNSSEQETNNE